ncbi:hypothetical protein TNCV_4832921 [Trichonephila clavipes]|nr:hypothetical protein TNCV_4832921 [Trichonephila clavipes]
MPPDRQMSDRCPRTSSWQRAKRRLSIAVALSNIQVTVPFGSVPPQFRVPHAAKALYSYKHPCLLQDSNPFPTAQQSASIELNFNALVLNYADILGTNFVYELFSSYEIDTCHKTTTLRQPKDIEPWQIQC